MKRFYIYILLLLSTSVFATETKTSYSISAGTEYLNDFFVNFGLSVITPLKDNKELDIKAALNIKKEDDGDKVEPLFNIPVKLGINFLFPINDKFTFLSGVGVSPTIRLAGDDKGFLIGPNAKLGLRLKIHPSMSIFLEGCQSLLIGPPEWMIPSTEIVAGVNFFM